MADLDVTIETPHDVQIEGGFNDQDAQQFFTEVIAEGPKETHTEVFTEIKHDHTEVIAESLKETHTEVTEVKNQQILHETQVNKEVLGATASEYDKFYSGVRALMGSCETALRDYPSSE
jgi:hypothetical protein